MKTRKYGLILILTILVLSSFNVFSTQNISKISFEKKYNKIGHETITSFGSSLKYTKKENKQNIDSNLNNFFVDPILEKNRNSPQKILVLFKDENSMNNFYSIIEEETTTKILAKFKIIPAIFIESKLDTILKLAQKTGAIVGLYANRKIQLADAYTLPSQIVDETKNRQYPTTSDTAQIIGADTFWENGYNGSDIVVCVIDTGIDSSHPELSGKIVAAKSFVLKKYGYEKDITDPEDEEGHGTACAGIIAGKGIDPRGQGMAPEAKLMNARIFSPNVEGATWAGIIAAIEWATYGPDETPNTGDEADIISMSIGGGEIYNSPMWLAIEKATEYGIIVSISAGNEGVNQIASMSV
ncbi:MAG: S8 family serine peptidase, partial [Candidatus Njordarchaeota archaeon]